MNAKTQYISQLIRATISEVDASAEVILYGSRARGEERTDSDWDILVLTEYAVDIHRERAFRDRLYDVELDTGEVFSLFVFSKQDWFSRQRITPFFENVMQEGISL
jgi:predicted nucleotidyltransferase